MRMTAKFVRPTSNARYECGDTAISSYGRLITSAYICDAIAVELPEVLAIPFVGVTLVFRDFDIQRRLASDVSLVFNTFDVRRDVVVSVSSSFDVRRDQLEFVRADFELRRNNLQFVSQTFDIRRDSLALVASDFDVRRDGLAIVTVSFDVQRSVGVSLTTVANVFEVQRSIIQSVENSFDIQRNGLVIVSNLFDVRRDGLSAVANQFEVRRSGLQFAEDSFDIRRNGLSFANNLFDIRRDGNALVSRLFDVRRDVALGLSTVLNDFNVQRSIEQFVNNSFDIRRNGLVTVQNTFDLRRNAIVAVNATFDVRRDILSSAPAGISYIGGLSTVITAGGGNHVIDISSLGVQTNDYIMLTYGSDRSNTNAQPVGYTELWTRNSSIYIHEGWRRVAASAETTITVPQNATRPRAATVKVFRGVNTTTPEDVVTVEVIGGAGQPNPPSSASLGGLGRVSVVAAWLDDDSITPTAPTDYIEIVSSIDPLGGTQMMAHRFLTTADAEDPGPFGGGNDAWSAATTILVPA